MPDYAISRLRFLQLKSFYLPPSLNRVVTTIYGKRHAIDNSHMQYIEIFDDKVPSGYIQCGCGLCYRRKSARNDQPTIRILREICTNNNNILFRLPSDSPRTDYKQLDLKSTFSLAVLPATGHLEFVFTDKNHNIIPEKSMDAGEYRRLPGAKSIDNYHRSAAIYNDSELIDKQGLTQKFWKQVVRGYTQRSYVFPESKNEEYWCRSDNTGCWRFYNALQEQYFVWRMYELQLNKNVKFNRMLQELKSGVNYEIITTSIPIPLMSLMPIPLMMEDLYNRYCKCEMTVEHALFAVLTLPSENLPWNIYFQRNRTIYPEKIFSTKLFATSDNNDIIQNYGGKRKRQE